MFDIRNIQLLLLSAACAWTLTVIGCEGDQSTGAATPAPPAPLASEEHRQAANIAVPSLPRDRPVIVRLAGRDQTIIVRAGADGSGPTYSVTDADGNVVGVDRTLKQLHAEDPQLYERIRSIIADPGDGILIAH